jgi:hypothetical protein
MNTQTNVDVNWVRSEKRSDSSLVRIVFDVVFVRPLESYTFTAELLNMTRWGTSLCVGRKGEAQWSEYLVLYDFIGHCATALESYRTNNGV